MNHQMKRIENKYHRVLIKINRCNNLNLCSVTLSAQFKLVVIKLIIK